MTGRHLRFLLAVLALMLVEAALVYLLLHASPVFRHPRGLLALSAAYFLCIPLNLFVAWLLTMRGSD